MKFHEIANVFPMLGKEDFARLAEDILENGLRHPIWLFEGKVLDGRNRYRACEVLGIKPEFKGFYGTFDDAVKFVTSENLVRRHLSAQQRAVSAERLATLQRGANQHTKEGLSQDRPSHSVADAAKLMNVSESSVHRVRAVKEQGVPELMEAVEQGEVGLLPAAELTKLPEEKQREALAGGKEKVKEAVKAAKALPPPVRQELSEEQQAMRRRQKTEKLFGSLVSSIVLVKKTVDQMAEVDMVMLPGDRELAEMAVAELKSVAGWLETLLKGEGVPDELPSWLDGGSK